MFVVLFYLYSLLIVLLLPYKALPEVATPIEDEDSRGLLACTYAFISMITWFPVASLVCSVQTGSSCGPGNALTWRPQISGCLDGAGKRQRHRDAVVWRWGIMWRRLHDLTLTLHAFYWAELTETPHWSVRTAEGKSGDLLSLPFQLSLWYILDHRTTANVTSQWLTTLCHQRSWDSWVSGVTVSVLVSCFSKVGSIMLDMCPNPGLICFIPHSGLERKSDLDIHVWGTFTSHFPLSEAACGWASEFIR